MNILGFDLSTRQGSLALFTDNKVALAREWPNDRRHSAPFFQLLYEVIVEHEPPDMIVVGIGPGSYTGNRIAISTGIGLARTSGARLAGLPSVATLSSKEEYVAIGDAKRQSFFFARVRGGRLPQPPEVISETEMLTRLSSIPLRCYTSDDLPQFHRASLRFPSAELLCRRANECPQNLIHAPLAPIYLREPHITKPRSKHDRTSSSLLG